MPINPDQLIKHAVDQIVSGINGGMTPQASTVKVARELSLNPHFIKRASEAINVALHYSHFKKHADAKADDFPIVDSQQVVASIYGGKEKTAAELKSDYLSSFQSEDVAPKFARYLEDGPHKEAFDRIASSEAALAYPMSEAGLYEKSANYIRDLKKSAETAKGNEVDADYRTNRAFCSVLESLAKSSEYRTPFDEFESQVFSIHGEKSAGYLDLLYKTARLTEPRGKHDSNYRLFPMCKEAAQFSSFIQLTDELPITKQASEDAAYNYKFEKDYVDSLHKQRGCTLFDKAAGADSSILDRLEAEMKKEASEIEAMEDEDPVMQAIKNQKRAALHVKEGKIKEAFSFIDTAMDSLKGEGKPSVRATSNTDEENRNRSFLLQELATTDPILSKQPTKRVVDSYQQMLRLSPEISNEKELVRAFLRQATASQAIGPFEGQQLVEADSKLLKHRMAQKGIYSGKDEGGK